jgi:hypothetical protein
MNRPKSSLQLRQEAEKRRAIFMIFAALLAAACVLWASVNFASPELSAETGCPIDNHSAPEAHTVILIDQTDALPADELRYVRQVIYNEYHWLPLAGRLTIRNIDAQIDQAQDVVTICRMPDEGEVNEIVANKDAVRQDFEAMAGAQLNAFLGVMATAEPQSRSPIIEAVLAVGGRTDFQKDVKARRMVVISDMIQNSDLSSHYGYSLPDGTVDSDDFNALGLKDVDVRVQYIKRRGAVMQGRKHMEFWRAFFNSRKVKSVGIGHDLGLRENADRKVWYQSSQLDKTK